MAPIKRILQAPLAFEKNPHIQTIYPNFFRNVDYNEGVRTLIKSSDKTPLEVFIKKPRSKKVVILTHGLEGCAQSSYIMGFRQLLERRKWDSISWNQRNCGNDFTLTHTVYHAGRTKDLRAIVDHAIDNLGYEEVYLVGYSLGGCVTLNYLGRENRRREIKSAVVVSTPMNLSRCSDTLTKMKNKHYQLYFLTLMFKKLRKLKELYPEHYKHAPPMYKLKCFRDFDKYITAPLSGMKDDQDYYDSHSPERELPKLDLPVKIMTSTDDPFLDSTSTNHPEFYRNPFIANERFDWGGHVGFWKGLGKEYFIENKIFDFLNSHQ